LARYRRSAGFALVAAVVAALGLSGCGRKAGLDMPPGDTPVASPQAEAAPAGPLSSSSFLPGSSQPKPNTPPPDAYDSQGNRVMSTPMSKTFVLDPLLQ
jgi:predicted small lipoprotein YifL